MKWQKFKDVFTLKDPKKQADGFDKFCQQTKRRTSVDKQRNLEPTKF